jgi:hypothetical protein
MFARVAADNTGTTFKPFRLPDELEKQISKAKRGELKHKPLAPSCFMLRASYQEQTDCVQVAGVYVLEEDDDLAQICIDIRVRSGTWPIKKHALPFVYSEIRETLRHELEHAQQPEPPEDLPYNCYPDVAPSEVDQFSTLDWWKSYLLDPSEIDAYAVATLLTAKKLHMPFHVHAVLSLNALRRRIIKATRCDPCDPNELIHEVYRRWTACLSQRFPNYNLAMLTPKAYVRIPRKKKIRELKQKGLWKSVA